jgi:CDP-diacylglycerol--glycerol-3-phosphate 3-phosphatidyltransferase
MPSSATERLRGPSTASGELDPPPRGPIGRAAVIIGHGVAAFFGCLRDLVARGIIALGFTPNTVTLIGPIVSLPVVAALYSGRQPLAGFLLIAAGAFDLLDGAVARLGGKVTPFGAFLDSVIDRYSDSLMFAGIFLYFLFHTSGVAQAVYLVLWALALVGTLLPSYVRARAETLIPLCKVGFMERAERTVTVIIGALSSNLHLTLIILAFFGNLITIERIFYTREELEPGSRRWGRLIWRYKRLSAPHVILCGTLIASLIIGHWLIPRP